MEHLEYNKYSLVFDSFLIDSLPYLPLAIYDHIVSSYKGSRAWSVLSTDPIILGHGGFRA